MADHTWSASTVSRTSCTRTMRAPRSTASTAAATLAATRSAGSSRPVTAPSAKPATFQIGWSAVGRTPRRAINGALEIAFTAKDDYGLREAHAEIMPIEQQPGATPLYALPDYKLDLPRHNARDTKGVASRNITEHPLAGQMVRITLVATDGAGQTGRCGIIWLHGNHFFRSVHFIVR